MRILLLKPHLTTAELSVKLGACINTHQKGYWQILLSVSVNPNKKAEEYAAFLGITKSKVYKVVELYNKEGAHFTDKLKWGGRRSQTSHLSIEEEKKMMNDLQLKAEEGKVLTAKHIRKAIETKVGKIVSDDYIWDLFKRHHWMKKMPRLEYPKKSKAAQKEVKKNYTKSWHPN